MKSKGQEYVHIWYHCHHCGKSPISGPRYHCVSCPDGPDNDLCEECYENHLQGTVPHPAKDSLGEQLNLPEHKFEKSEGELASQFEPWLKVKNPKAEAPALPKYSVVRPIFSAGADSAIAGYAFAASPGEGREPVLLTALHVLDELIKKKCINCDNNNEHYTGRELPSAITDVDLYDVYAPNWMMCPVGPAGRMLVLPQARTGEKEPLSDLDIAAFRLTGNTKVRPLPLATEPPKVGDAVFNAARIDGKPGKFMMGQVVVEITDRTMILKSLNPAEKTPYSSGSPILNQAGEVVGLKVGGGRFKGQRLAHANHIGNIRRHLKDAGIL